MVFTNITRSTRTASLLSKRIPVASLSTTNIHMNNFHTTRSRFHSSNLNYSNDTIILSSSSRSLLSNQSSRRYKSIRPSFDNDNNDSQGGITLTKEGLMNDGRDVVSEIVNFPSTPQNNSNEEHRNMDTATTPVLLNSKEHAVGYLNKILNAKVYEAAIETQLQHAKSLSTVRFFYSKYINREYDTSLCLENEDM